MEERSDRAVASLGWITRFTHARVIHITLTTSDHLPIFLDLQNGRRGRSNRGFKYENSWSKEGECERIIKEVWTSNPQMDVQSKLDRCGEVLGEWGRKINKELHVKMKAQKQIIEN